MSAVFEDIAAAVGYTPLVRINRLATGNATLLAKLESKNPCGSVKDRIAKFMIQAAEEQGLIKADTSIVEPTSGNTGIGLAFICAAKDISLTLTMPESMSIERRKLLQMLGAHIVLTPAAEGMSGAITKAEQLVADTPNALMLQQFKNPANPRAHRETTAKEIWVDTDGEIDTGRWRWHRGDPDRLWGGSQGEESESQGGGGGARRLARVVGGRSGTPQDPGYRCRLRAGRAENGLDR
jgi:cysteine synthase